MSLVVALGFATMEVKCVELDRSVHPKEMFSEASRVLVRLLFTNNNKNLTHYQDRAFKQDPLQRWFFQRDHDTFDKLFFDCACIYMSYDNDMAFIQSGMWY